MKEYKQMKVGIDKNTFIIADCEYTISLQDSILQKFMFFFNMQHLFYEEGKTKPLSFIAGKESGKILKTVVRNDVLKQLFGGGGKMELLLYICIICSAIALLIGVFNAYNTQNIKTLLDTVIKSLPVQPVVIK